MFADYVRGDRQPDHAVLDEQLNTLRQARTRANGTTATEINSAIEVVEDYRESIYQDR